MDVFFVAALIALGGELDEEGLTQLKALMGGRVLCSFEDPFVEEVGYSLEEDSEDRI